MIRVPFKERFELDEQDNEDVSYICTIEVRNHLVEVFESDYGQCYFIKTKNLSTGEIEEIGLGTYNSAIIESILDFLDPKGAYASGGYLDSWYEMDKHLQERGLPSRDYDDYQVYDINGFYEDLRSLNELK